MYLPKEAFLQRRAPGGEASLAYEFAALEKGPEVWVVLRERQGAAQPVFPAYFQQIATLVRQELRYLRQVKNPLRFFFLAKQLKPTGGFRWQVNEVQTSMNSEFVATCIWEAPNEEKTLELAQDLAL